MKKLIYLLLILASFLTSCSDFEEEPRYSMGIEVIDGVKYHRFAVKGGTDYVKVMEDGKFVRK